MTDELSPEVPVQHDLSPDAVVVAIEECAVESVRSWGAWSELELTDGAELVQTITEIPFPFFNCAVRPRLTEENVDGVIAASVARATERGVPLSWWLGPAPTPSAPADAEADVAAGDLEARLEDAGFEKMDELIGMAVDLEEIADAPTYPAGLTIEEVTDNKMFARFCFSLGPNFEFPPQAISAWRRCYEAVGFGPGRAWRHFLALADGAPVATASLFCGAGVASIVNVGTAADWRGRGVGRIVSAHPLALARDAGYRLGTLWASKMGAPMYRRLGFRPYCLGPVFLWVP